MYVLGQQDKERGPRKLISADAQASTFLAPARPSSAHLRTPHAQPLAKALVLTLINALVCPISPHPQRPTPSNLPAGKQG